MTQYRCECGAEDSDHQNYTDPPAALICYNCKAGSRMTVTDQIRHGVGMLPVYEQEEN